MDGDSEDSVCCPGSGRTGKGSVGDGISGPGSRSLGRMGFFTLDDFNVRGRKILVRVDINSPVDERTLRLEDGSKIRSSVPTIRELIDRGARVAILAHQGRPGDYDFISLNEHAQYLSQFTGKKIRYVDDILGPHAMRAIQNLADGEAILMQNVRNLSEEQVKRSPEEHSESQLVKTLSSKFDLYVNDAFGSSHRAHASLVGFTPVMPSAAGRLLEREVSTLSKVFQTPARPSTYIFGGTKFSDALQAIEKLADKDNADNLIIAGLAGYAFLWVLGKRVGARTEDKIKKDVGEEVAAAARKLYDRRKEKIQLPVDGAVEIEDHRVEFDIDKMPGDAAILDIGSASIERFNKTIMASKTVFLSGPPGMFEREEFCKGTKEMFEAIIESGAYSVIGGGHSGAAANKLGLLDKFSYVSTGGGALERLMLGKEMPVIEALRASAKKL